MPEPSHRRSPREENKRESRKNIKGSVRDRLQSCIGLSRCGLDVVGSESDPESSSSSGEGCNTDVRTALKENSSQGEYWNLISVDGRMQISAASRRKSQILDWWTSRQVEETIKNQACEAEIHPLSVSTVPSSFLRETSPSRSEYWTKEMTNLRASLLVQKWREFEAEATMSASSRSGSPNSACSASTNAISTSYGSSPNEKPGYEYDRRIESVVAVGNGFTEPESGSVPSVVSYFPDGERGRVSDMVRRLNSGRRNESLSASCSDENERPKSAPAVLDRKRSFSEILSGNCRFIRGRQATRDLLKRIERDRQIEIAGLIQLHPVSRFSHRSRIQALLKFKLLQNKVSGQETRCSSSTASELDELQRRTSISLLRERFSSKIGSDSCFPSSSNCSTRTKQNSVDSNHFVSKQLSNENVGDPHVPIQDHGRDGAQLTPPSMLTAGEGWQKHVQSPDSDLKKKGASVHESSKCSPEFSQSASLLLQSASEDRQNDGNQSLGSVWKERRPPVEDISWQENITKPTHGEFETGSIVLIEDKVSTSYQIVRRECHGVASSFNDSSPSRREYMNQGQISHESSEFTKLHRRSIDDSDCHATMNAVTSEHNSCTRQHEEHIHPTCPIHASHPERLGNDYGETMYQLLHVPISDEEKRDCLTADLDTENEHRVGLGQRVKDNCSNTLCQAWLERFSENKEILELLARRRVSTALSSDFRVKMDKLMATILQRKAKQHSMEDGIAVEEEDSANLFDPEESLSVHQIASPSTQQLFPSFFSEQGYEQQSSASMYNEEQNRPRLLDNEVKATSAQPLPSQLLHELVYQQQTSSRAYNCEERNTNQNSSTSIDMPFHSHTIDNRHSQPMNFLYTSPVEMDLIYDFRKEMMSLRQDMHELRRSLGSCMKMQMQLQHSIKQAFPVTSHAGAESG